MEWSRGSWKDSVLVITHSKGERKKSCISRGLCWRGLVNPPFPLGLPLVEVQRNLPGLPWTQRQVVDVIWTEKQDGCHPLGKAALWMPTSFPIIPFGLPFPLLPSKINNLLLFTLSPPSLGLVILVILVFASNFFKSGNLLYSHCPLTFFIQEELPIPPFLHVWHLSVPWVVLSV